MDKMEGQSCMLYDKIENSIYQGAMIDGERHGDGKQIYHNNGTSF